MPSSVTLSPCRRIDGSIRVPGDKSISHRALLVGALGEGDMEIVGLSPALDVQASRRALAALGLNIHSLVKDESRPKEGSTSPLDREILEGSARASLIDPGSAIDVGNSGTTIRLLLGILAGSRVQAVLTGDESIRRRPMDRVVEPLRRMGAEIDGPHGGRHPPLTVRGRPLHGTDHVLPVASAQVKSALLLAGLQAEGTTTIQEPHRSRDHTERLLRYLGVQIDEERDRLIVKSTKFYNASVTVPGDLSSAAFFLVAAAVLPGSDVTIPDVGINPTRTGILEILERFGADVMIEDRREQCGEPVGTVRVRAGERRPVEVGGALAVRSIDELPLVAILGSVAEGKTVVQDASELRVKESDRIAAIAAGLGAMGVSLDPTPDGFNIRGPQPLKGTPVDSAGDHRIAMALGVAALIAEGPTQISGWHDVAVSYPGFEQDLAALVR